jgi:hypothetical protein
MPWWTSATPTANNPQAPRSQGRRRFAGLSAVPVEDLAPALRRGVTAGSEVAQVLGPRRGVGEPVGVGAGFRDDGAEGERSTMAAHSRGSVKVSVQPLNASLLATATGGFLFAFQDRCR